MLLPASVRKSENCVPSTRNKKRKSRDNCVCLKTLSYCMAITLLPQPLGSQIASVYHHARQKISNNMKKINYC